LTSAERRRLLAAIALGQAENLLGRAKLALGRIPFKAHSLDVTAFQPPDSRLAREAEEACAEQPALIAAHSYRTWIFGQALAFVDDVDLDAELFYCAALVHDFGIASPIEGRDFTLGGAERALGCAAAAGLTQEQGDAIADAICVHPTPGVKLERDGSLGCYVQWGAMADGGGLRLCDISRENVRAALEAHPRGSGFKAGLTAMIRSEAKAVPGGRFDLLVRCGVPLVIRLAPFAD
jgi:hypothetical protein